MNMSEENFRFLHRDEMGLMLYLITDSYCVIMAILAVFGNLVILYLFFTKRLDSRRNLHIILFMAVADIIFAISIMPQIVYMIIYWNSTLINYNPYVMAITGSPLPLFLKISSGLHAGAATERILALYFPILYRKMDHVDCSNLLMLISVILGSIDTVLALCTFEYEPHLNCSSIGCMVNDLFRTYWGASNMSCGIIIVVMSVFVFFKVQKLERESDKIGGSKPTKIVSKKFRQANHTTCGILLSSLFCLTIPSLLISLVETFVGFSIFDQFGPIYAASLLTSGFTSCLTFLILNGPYKNSTSSPILAEPTTIGISLKQRTITGIV